MAVLIERKDWEIVIAKAKPEAISRPKMSLLRRSAPRNESLEQCRCERSEAICSDKKMCGLI